MTRAARRLESVILAGMLAALAVCWALPLRWPTGAIASGIVLTLTLASLRASRSVMIVAATGAITITAIVSFGYAAYALLHPGVFGPINRLGYPFLVGTGLRLEGGAWLLLLCATVVAVPLLFNDESRTQG